MLGCNRIQVLNPSKAWEDHFKNKRKSLGGRVGLGDLERARPDLDACGRWDTTARRLDSRQRHGMEGKPTSACCSPRASIPARAGRGRRRDCSGGTGGRGEFTALPLLAFPLGVAAYG